MTPLRSARVVALIVAAFPVVSASSGDVNPWYRACLQRCRYAACKGGGNLSEFPLMMELTTTAEPGRSPAIADWTETRTAHEDATKPAAGKQQKADGSRELLRASEEETIDAGGRGQGEGRAEPVVTYFPPLYLRLMGWDCWSECAYTCMTMHVEQTVSTGQTMLQYNGKWPFRRVWGVQELFASLFSAGNGLPHLYHVLYSRGAYNPPGHYMQLWLTLYPWVGMNTWLWSTVFHARDVRWTEAADYFCALLNIFFALWIVVLRVAGPPRNRRRLVGVLLPIVGASMCIFYVRHIHHMWYVTFDYGYNMKIALAAGVMHTLLWLWYQYRARERAYARRGAVIVILLNAAILLELGDFPPVAYRTLDAHAVWHMVTIPLGFTWYNFLMGDAKHEAALAAGKAT